MLRSDSEDGRDDGNIKNKAKSMTAKLYLVLAPDNLLIKTYPRVEFGAIPMLRVIGDFRL